MQRSHGLSVGRSARAPPPTPPTFAVRRRSYQPRSYRSFRSGWMPHRPGVRRVPLRRLSGPGGRAGPASALCLLVDGVPRGATALVVAGVSPVIASHLLCPPRLAPPASARPPATRQWTSPPKKRCRRRLDGRGLGSGDILNV